MQKWLELLSKITLFGFAFLVVIFISLEILEWSDSWKGYFSFTGQIEWYVLIFAIAFVLSFVFKKLLIWVYRAEFEQPETRQINQVRLPKSRLYRKHR